MKKDFRVSSLPSLQASLAQALDNLVGIFLPLVWTDLSHIFHGELEGVESGIVNSVSAWFDPRRIRYEGGGTATHEQLDAVLE
jgi:hypothetical protein